MNLETKRLIIRKFDIKDAQDLHKILSDAEVMKYIEPVFDMDKTKQFIEKYGMCASPLICAVEWRQTNELIGHVICHPYDENSYEIGWVLRRECWGRGIADELTKALIWYLQGTAEYCVIECDERQIASAHIALKNGFEFIGRENGLDIYVIKLQK